MKIGIMQPYFMPYIGYWQLMSAVDVYVVFDDVNFINRGWINRNNILLNGGSHMFTIALSKASQNKKINEIEILDDFSKLKKTLHMAYSKAPYYEDVMMCFDKITECKDRHVGRFILNSFRMVFEYLNVSKTFILSSEIEKNNELKGCEKIKQICTLMHADEYYNAIGGQSLYDREDFYRSGINLRFLRTKEIVYQQFGNAFVPNLSIIDVMMFNSPMEIKENMLNRFDLV